MFHSFWQKATQSTNVQTHEHFKMWNTHLLLFFLFVLLVVFVVVFVVLFCFGFGFVWVLLWFFFHISSGKSQNSSSAPGVDWHESIIPHFSLWGCQVLNQGDVRAQEEPREPSSQKERSRHILSLAQQEQMCSLQVLSPFSWESPGWKFPHAKLSPHSELFTALQPELQEQGCAPGTAQSQLGQGDCHNSWGAATKISQAEMCGSTKLSLICHSKLLLFCCACHVRAPEF